MKTVEGRGSLEMMMTMPKDETEPEYRKNSHKLRMLRNYTKVQRERKKESRQRAMLMEWLLSFYSKLKSYRAHFFLTNYDYFHSFRNIFFFWFTFRLKCAHFLLCRCCCCCRCCILPSNTHTRSLHSRAVSSFSRWHYSIVWSFFFNSFFFKFKSIKTRQMTLAAILASLTFYNLNHIIILFSWHILCASPPHFNVAINYEVPAFLLIICFTDFIIFVVCLNESDEIFV